MEIAQALTAFFKQYQGITGVGLKRDNGVLG